MGLYEYVKEEELGLMVYSGEGVRKVEGTTKSCSLGSCGACKVC